MKFKNWRLEEGGLAALARDQTTSSAEDPPSPMSSISIGRTPM